MLLVAVAIVAVCVAAGAPPEAGVRRRFEDFKAQYGRRYASSAEEADHFAIFAENLAIAAELARANPLARFGVTKFSDVSRTRFMTALGERRVQRNDENKKLHEAPVAELGITDVLTASGQTVDWREKGAVTPVKDQQSCNAGWAFSATGNMEAQWFLAGHPLVNLSEQLLVSCDTNNQGCVKSSNFGGPYQFLVTNMNGHIATGESYPYSGSDYTCRCCLAQKLGATIDSWVSVPGNETLMAAWVYKNGPLAVGVDSTSWQTYISGIMTWCSANKVSHGALIVGFDDNNNPPYWIIKNSWSSEWGENGYIRVAKGSNQCLIASSPVSSVVVPPNA